MKISVALCTFNGSRFLKQQLESIATQIRLPDELVVCDDGSTDATISILENFITNAPFPVHIYRNLTNLGACGNFCKAIELCGGDLIALSDQDDVWQADKLFRAQFAIEQCRNPTSTLYCSGLQYVNANLELIGKSQVPRFTDFSNAIVENIATGCTVVFGEEIRRLILFSDPKDMLMHDWWAYLVASAFGQVVYDPSSTVLYRQHGSNVAGWKPKPLKLWNRTKRLVQRLFQETLGMDSLNQAERFIATFPDISKENRKIVEELLFLRNESKLKRMAYAFHPRVRRNDKLENFGLKVMLFMGWH